LEQLYFFSSFFFFVFFSKKKKRGKKNEEKKRRKISIETLEKSLFFACGEINILFSTSKKKCS